MKCNIWETYCIDNIRSYCQYLCFLVPLNQRNVMLTNIIKTPVYSFTSEVLGSPIKHIQILLRFLFLHFTVYIYFRGSYKFLHSTALYTFEVLACFYILQYILLRFLAFQFTVYTGTLKLEVFLLSSSWNILVFQFTVYIFEVLYWSPSLQYLLLKFLISSPVYTQKYYFPGLTFYRIYLWGSWFQFTVHVYTFEVHSSAHLLLIWIVINLGRDLPNIWLTCIQAGSNCGVPIAED